MSIENFLNNLKNKIKDNNSRKPCPTPVLLYLAARWNYHSEVEPWYERIKKLSGNADKNSLEFHSAVVCGMYPQLKSAGAYFAQKAEEYLKENRASAEEWRDKSVKKRIIGELKKSSRIPSINSVYRKLMIFIICPKNRKIALSTI